MSRKIVHQPLGHRTTLQLQDRGHDSRLFEVVDLTVGKHSQQPLKQQRKNGGMVGTLGGRLDRLTGGYSVPSGCLVGQAHLAKVPRIGDVANRSSTVCQVQGQGSRQLCRWQPCCAVFGGTGRRITHILYQFRILISVYFRDPVMIQRPGRSPSTVTLEVRSSGYEIRGIDT